MNMAGLIADAWPGWLSLLRRSVITGREVTLGDDACRTASRQGAAVLASLRNLTNGICELEKEHKSITADTLNSSCEQQTFTTVWPILNR
jgi:hypothetical protein